MDNQEAVLEGKREKPLDQQFQLRYLQGQADNADEGGELV